MTKQRLTDISDILHAMRTGTGSSWLAALIMTAMLASAACTTTPAKVPTDFELADRYSQDGLYREAIDHYGRALNKDSNNYGAHRNLGIVLIRVGEYKKAAEHLKKSAPAFEDNFEMNYYLGEALRATETYGEAIYRYQKALAIRRDDPRALKALSWSYFKIRYYTEALTTAKKLVKAMPKDTQATLILARTQLKLRDFKSAYRVIKAAKSDADNDQRAYLDSVEGDIWAAAGKCEKAADIYKSALKQQPLLAGAAFGLGKCEMSSGNTKVAIPYLERAMRLRPQMHEGLFYLGKAYEATDAKKSQRYYRSFVKHAATDPELTAEFSAAKKALVHGKAAKAGKLEQL